MLGDWDFAHFCGFGFFGWRWTCWGFNFHGSSICVLVRLHRIWNNQSFIQVCPGVKQVLLLLPACSWSFRFVVLTDLSEEPVVSWVEVIVTALQGLTLTRAWKNSKIEHVCCLFWLEVHFLVTRCRCQIKMSKQRNATFLRIWKVAKLRLPAKNLEMRALYVQVIIEIGNQKIAQVNLSLSIFSFLNSEFTRNP